MLKLYLSATVPVSQTIEIMAFRIYRTEHVLRAGWINDESSTQLSCVMLLYMDSIARNVECMPSDTEFP